jgi:hypothetical protein
LIRDVVLRSVREHVPGRVRGGPGGDGPSRRMSVLGLYAPQREKGPGAWPVDHRRVGCVVRSARSSCHPSSSSRIPTARSRPVPAPATSTLRRTAGHGDGPSASAPACIRLRHLPRFTTTDHTNRHPAPLRPLGYERRGQSLPRTATSPQHRPGSAKTSAAVSTRLTRSDPTRRDPFTTVGDRRGTSRAEVAPAPVTTRDTPLVVRRPAGRRPRVETRLHVDGGASGVDRTPAGCHWRLKVSPLGQCCRTSGADKDPTVDATGYPCPGDQHPPRPVLGPSRRRGPPEARMFDRELGNNMTWPGQRC